MSLSMGVFCSAPRDNSKKLLLQTEFDLIFSGFLPFQTENSLTREIVTKTMAQKWDSVREGEFQILLGSPSSTLESGIDEWPVHQPFVTNSCRRKTRESDRI